MSAVPSTTTLEARAEAFRGELIGYCYRYFGSYAEAEDAVQETMVRAWQHADRFEERASVRTWLYKIATNICLDMKRAPQRRALPTDLAGPGRVPENPSALTTRPEPTWIGPVADAHLDIPTDPADVAELRETVRLALLTALQVLPPKQRVVLILRDVVAWSAQECADLLEISVASVNSALARARATVAEHDPDAARATPVEDDEALLMNYVEAFEAYDVARLVQLLADDARFSMPPFELWLSGADEIERWWNGPGRVCLNSRTILTRANGKTAVAVYHDEGAGRWAPFALHLLDTRAGRITAITHFMGPRVFAEFGLPDEVREPV